MVNKDVKFKRWFVETASQEGQPVKRNVRIDVPQECVVISRVLRGYYSPNVQVYVVGGAVRDSLLGKTPKDFDLTTDLSEEEIIAALRSPLGQRNNIRVNEKESVDTFGVVFVTVGNTPVIEVAPFRRDIGGTGRRPDAVERGNIYDDAMRRDFTINNLYYDFDKGEVLDFNPGGQGLQDIQNGVVRPVGDPFERFTEDKLRILRLMRFFARFNPGDIAQFLDQRTLSAIEHFKDLKAWGITPERIMTEFTSGIKQAQDVGSYLQNYAKLDLFQAVFPGLSVNTQDIPRLHNCRNVKIIYAILLRGNANINRVLNALKYPVPVSEGVKFLVDLMGFDPDAQADSQTAIYNAVRNKERLAAMAPPAVTDTDLQEFVVVARGLVDTSRIEHLIGYQPQRVSGEDLMRQGYKGKEIGVRQKELGAQHYTNSWQSFRQARSPAVPTEIPQRNLPGTES